MTARFGAEYNGAMTDPTDPTFVLTLTCPDRAGIVHAVTGLLVEQRGNILESQQFSDLAENRFFMRVRFAIEGAGAETLERLRSAFAPVAERWGMTWELWDAGAPYRTLILVSKFSHCLNDLLFRWSSGSLQIDVVGVVSNHPDCERLVASYGVPYHHVPVTADTKADAEKRLLELVDDEGVDLVVLARYMQVLSDDTCRRLTGKAINIHHSFLPSFKGARPYHQAFDRGVKLVGATAHYVTGDLDEGPIIEQEMLRVGHQLSPEQLAARGREAETRALARAVRWHTENRIVIHESRTVVFE
ncbi:MAG TPA: formyltetrahydrofolate deformylase [Nocardioidaceae bacterium]|nr:formyltetrahydrofolate deformylase [Nocardioidaceae bacterium]